MAEFCACVCSAGIILLTLIVVADLSRQRCRKCERCIKWIDDRDERMILVAKPKNAYLAKIQAQAQAKEARKTEAHTELDTMAMLLAAHDVLHVGPGRSDPLVNSFLAWKLEIAEDIDKELREDLSKKKELVIVKRNLAYKLQEILGAEGWEKWKTLFPFLRDFW